ncbi:DAK2 domain-containing protein [Anaerosinus gibii]|uniref:DAK2 domain-containing protein n=1 Tax=Selenobaculum gibii TaxID=3054208 RepID=A0A9Y2ESN0_9FIRM|nr:DAK2 domain-containing protein [Selenobaculum gbiensis]WIW71118.1 DAK2 domain-containing protein [Selenobaculum gbiensis]
MAGNKEIITGNDFKCMIAGAYNAFSLEHENINRLNVFPVPDGDTGTNMLRTLGAVARAVAEASETSIGELSKKAATSAIMGARGNSGVILSQIFRGLARGLEGKDTVCSAGLGKAFQYGVLYAYRSVSKPVEGTILTVAKGIAKGAHHAVRADLPIMEILKEAVAGGNRELARTPDLLPALKAAGVVDAGGKGLIVFLEGCIAGLGGDLPTAPEVTFEKSFKAAAKMPAEDFEITRPYCTEFMVKDSTVKAVEARKVLMKMGDSLVVADGGEILKIHIHTDNPGKVLAQGISWGSLHDIKVDNMADQHRSLVIDEEAKEPELKVAVISVAAGEGLAEIMKGLGASIIISGGQSMNPSVEEFVDAINSNIAEKYIILPNNSNIVLAAAQVKKMLGDRVEIVPTVNTPQGLSVLMAFDPSLDIMESVNHMTEAMQGVREAAITQAVRDSKVDGVLVEEGAYLGVIGGKVKLYGDNINKVIVDTVKKISDDECEVVSLYYGKNIKTEDAEAFAEMLEDIFPDLEVEIYAGGQPHYHLLISVE